MSLKGFHIVFIIVASALVLGFGLWSLQQEGSGYGLLGAVSLGLGALLVGYGIWFLRKLRHLSSL